MLHVACCLWDPNDKSPRFSRCYNEGWVEKLYRGFQRNLTKPFRFVVFTDKDRKFCSRGIEQQRLRTKVPDYGCLIEPFVLNEPSIICGLDMVVVGNIDHFADYCETADKMAMPIHPSKPEVAINPIVFVPRGHRYVFDNWRGENDMEWLGRQPHVKTDPFWPGQILSFKLHDVRRRGIKGARIIYMHGSSKPHELHDVDWVRKHWV